MLGLLPILLAAAEPVKRPTVRWVDPPTPAEVAAAKRAPAGPGPRAEPAPDVDPRTGMILRVDLETRAPTRGPVQNGTKRVLKKVPRTR